MFEINYYFQNPYPHRVLNWLVLTAHVAVCVVWVFAWGAACDARSAESVRRIEFTAEVAIITIPDGYKVGHEQPGIPGIIEMLPRKQKIAKWRDLFTIGTLPHSPEAPEDFALRAQQKFAETCGGKYMTADWNIGSHHGVPTTMWMQVCEKHKSGPSKGKTELDIVLLLQGKEVDLVLMRGFRYEASEHISFWKDFLLKSSLQAK